MFNFTTLPPLSLYIHLPWCVRKCPYCDFNSHQTPAGSDELPEQAYVEALIRDLEQELPTVWGRQLHSVFIGGGTPSLFSPAALDRLLCAVRACLPMPPTTEITMEANPGTVEAGKFREFRAIGINRLSLGIQSFEDRLLAAIGRIHDGREARRAVEIAQAAGFDNFNLDLMFGLPDQSVSQALQDLETAFDLGPSHLSHYQLTLEPNTLFHQQPPRLPDEDALWEMQQRCRQRLQEEGYEHYEVSAYAQKGHRCTHNLNYWQFGDYLGIGAGAHGKVSDARFQTITRTWKVKNPRDYLQWAGSEQCIGGQQQLSGDDAGFEFMLNALRLTEGFPSALFASHTGLPLNRLETPLKQAEQRGLLEWTVLKVSPTELGQRYLNDLLELFLID